MFVSICYLNFFFSLCCHLLLPPIAVAESLKETVADRVAIQTIQLMVCDDKDSNKGVLVETATKQPNSVT